MTQDQTPQSFENALIASDDTDAVKRCVEKEVQRRGFDYFAYVQLTLPQNGAERLYIGNYPDEWSELYKKNHLDIFDPLYNLALTATEPYFWDGIEWDENQRKNVLKPAAALGLRSGVGIPCRSEDGTIAGLQIVADCAAADLRGRFAIHRPALIAMAEALHRRVPDLVKRKLWKKLTPRQAQTLTLLARGLANKEIARVLELSPDMVGEHVSALIKVFGVQNRTKLAVIATTLENVVL